MKQVYLRLFPYECGKHRYLDCPLYQLVPPKFSAKTEDMFCIGDQDNVPINSMALEYNPRCGLDKNAKKSVIHDWQDICSQCGRKQKLCQSEKNFTFSRGKYVQVQPYAPRTLIRLMSYNDKKQKLFIPNFLKQESEFSEHISGKYYSWVILTVNDDCVFDFSDPNNNAEWFNRILRAIAMRGEIVH